MNASVSLQQIKLRCCLSDPKSTYSIHLSSKLDTHDWLLKLETDPNAQNADSFENNELIDVTWGDLSSDPMETVTCNRFSIKASL